MKHLLPREIYVLRLYYNEEKTIKEISDIMNVSHTLIAQIKAKAFMLLCKNHYNMKNTYKLPFQLKQALVKNALIMYPKVIIRNNLYDWVR